MKNRSSRWLTTVGVLVLIVALLTVLSFRFHLIDGLQLGNLLQESLQQPQVSADLVLSVRTDGQELTLESTLFRQTDKQGNLYGLQADPAALYFSDHRLIFDNGRAYDLEDSLPSIPITGKSLLKLLPLARIETEKTDADAVYRLTLTGEQLRRQSETIPAESSLHVEFAARAQQLHRVDLHLLTPERELHALVTLHPERSHTIPEPVAQARTAEEVPSIRVFEPLTSALFALIREPATAAVLNLRADCGPVTLSDTVPLFRTPNGVYLEQRQKLRQLETLDFSGQTLLGLGYQLCRAGRIDRVDDSGTYALIFPAERIRDACVELLPEIALLPISYDDGSLILTVEHNALRSAEVEVSGSMPVLVTTVDIALGLSLSPAEPGSVEIPEEIQ